MAVKLICEGVKDQNLTEQKGASKKILSDLILRKKVEIAIHSLPKADGHQLDISAKDGVITISGHVHSETDHRGVLGTVNKVEGVKEVVNDFRILKYHTYTMEC
jgi:osmotically-inducible protein OsmY